ncbi:hypothetical protein BHE74_00053802 [Ensete ventricosum]|nr:hypothetical protein BHE74_00053802 [Ensete ventricosum]RZS20955.1 hypothetical protein BHM03_00053539 [Ensete ventricosum]
MREGARTGAESRPSVGSISWAEAFVTYLRDGRGEKSSRRDLTDTCQYEAERRGVPSDLLTTTASGRVRPTEANRGGRATSEHLRCSDREAARLSIYLSICA